MHRIILLFASLFFCLSVAAQTNGQYAVQVAAFIEKVPTSYFKGMSGVYMSKDQNDIYRYYTGNYNDKSQAETALATAKNAGYNARIVDFEEQRRLCAEACAIPMVRPVSEATSYLESIFFDFDRSSLRAKSKTELDKLYQILVDNPAFSAQLRAHTDSKGSDEYNIALSERRANAAKQYLINKGIASSRLETKVYGEKDPIAVNESGGQDVPEGRQFNRRVQLIVFNSAGEEVNVVRDISVPGGLKFM